jgi:dTDP-4-amino-4,6-dideoxygalactose transaminase
MRPLLPSYEQIGELVRVIDDSRVYSNLGPVLEQYREELASYLKVPKNQICLIANATLAIQGLVTILSPQKWVVPDWTFSATGLAVLGSGKKLILSDIQETDWEMDGLAFESDLGREPNGFIPVAPYGNTPNILKWKEHEFVIHDAAASFGSPPTNVDDLNSTSAIVYSLHATKVIGAGEGAVVVCGSAEMAVNLQKWSNFGFDGNRKSMAYGTNAKLSEISCAYGLTSLRLRDVEIQEWRTPLAAAKAASEGKDWQTFVSNLSGIRPYWIARFPDQNTRNRIISRLENAGIQSRMWWAAPLSQMPAFRNVAPRVSNSISQKLAGTTLGLPMFRGLKSEQIDQIVSVIENTVNFETGVTN